MKEFRVKREEGRLLPAGNAPVARMPTARFYSSLFTLNSSRCFLAILALLCAAPLAAQQPSPAQVQQVLQQSPDLVRQRIQQSGLSPDQIRDRLQAAGYARTLLDPFISGAPEVAAQAAINQEMLKALDALSVGPGQPQGLERVPTAAGPERPAPAAAVAPELQLFGADIFRGRTTQFQPQLTGPVPPNYRLGPGDVMVLVLTGDVEMVHTLEVTREGFIVIPQVGQIYVNNLSMDQMRQTLRERLGRSYSGIRAGTTKFDVTIARLRTNQVFVVGEVLQPGAYQLASVATVLNALYAAGGPSDRGNFRRIEVRRLGSLINTFDLYDYLLGGNTGNDVVLEQGDVVFIPTHGTRARITGAVIRPALYELKPGQTLADLVDAAGGFRADAALERISISRIVPPGQRQPNAPDRIVVDVPTAQMLDGRAPPFPVEPGDSVHVFAVPAAQRGMVELAGAVYHPGTYGWRPGLRLSELVKLAGGFRPAVYSGLAHIERLNLADSTRYMLQVSLPEDSTKPYPDDLQLVDYDVVTVYGREEFREGRTVGIAGMVNKPGRFPYRKGMTLRDLVLMARGLRDGAYLDTAEVARLPEDRTGGRLAVTIRVPMDSTYLFEPDSSSYPFLRGLPAPARGAPEVALEPYDQVLILRQPQFELQRTVDIVGEVKFPGTYALISKDERLSDLLKRAGGLLPTGHAEGTRLVRPFGNAGLVDIRLTEAVRRPGSTDDLVLMPGDTIRVPELNPVVRVEGAVNSPTSVQYRPGAGLGYYIGSAGGYAQNADKGRVSVHYANGAGRVRSKFLFFSSYPTPGPGSTVKVPVAPQGAPFNVTEFVGSFAQILASTVAILVIATRL
ncbi:MAG: SLBB domain-containing protein [Gemmatimonadetes bacterium]|nr:SLBB domain-containing protein [Gemmatimonadota bacterium]